MSTETAARDALARGRELEREWTAERERVVRGLSAYSTGLVDKELDEARAMIADATTTLTRVAVDRLVAQAQSAVWDGHEETERVAADVADQMMALFAARVSR